MKVELHEYKGCYEIALTAESVADAAKLARLSTNRTTELRACGADAFNDGTFCGHVVIGKRKNNTSAIK